MKFPLNFPAAGFFAFSVLVIATASASSCLAQYDLPQLPDPGHTSISRQQQEQLGFKAATDVYKQMPVLPDNSPETQYVRQIGERLAAAIPQDNAWPFQFHVVAQKEINAFALPGGEMFVNLGAITAASNEAELAGVMAHEMGHVYMQHSAKQMQKAQMAQEFEGIAGAILGDRGGILGSLGQTGIQLGTGMMMLKYSRTDEAQADAVGATILERAGYNPEALADFFKKLEAQGGNGPQFLSDHPNPGNREEAIQNEIRNWPQENYRTDNAAFMAAQKRAMSEKAYTADEITQGAKTGQWTSLNKSRGAVLIPPAGMSIAENTASGGAASPASTSGTSGTASPANSSTAAGAVAWNSVAPSRSFVFSDLGTVKMVRPQNWDVIASQQGQSTTIAPRAGVASNGVGYGVVVNAVTLKDKSMSLNQATDAIVSALQKGGNDLQTVGSPTEIQVAGVSGRSVQMESTSPFPDANGQSQRERDQLVTIPQGDGTVVYLVFVSPAQDATRLSATFKRMLKSVQF